MSEVENLKMVCRRLAAAGSLEIRDRIAKQCVSLFEGSILRDAQPQASKSAGEFPDEQVNELLKTLEHIAWCDGKPASHPQEALDYRRDIARSAAERFRNSLKKGRASLPSSIRETSLSSNTDNSVNRISEASLPSGEPEMEWVTSPGPFMVDNITIDQRYRFEKEITQLKEQLESAKVIAQINADACANRERKDIERLERIESQTDSLGKLREQLTQGRAERDELMKLTYGQLLDKTLEEITKLEYVEYWKPLVVNRISELEEQLNQAQAEAIRYRSAIEKAIHLDDYGSVDDDKPFDVLRQALKQDEGT